MFLVFVEIIWLVRLRGVSIGEIRGKEEGGGGCRRDLPDGVEGVRSGRQLVPLFREWSSYIELCRHRWNKSIRILSRTLLEFEHVSVFSPTQTEFEKV